jgi:hypothetical protein
MNDTTGTTSAVAYQGTGFAGEIAGQQPHAIDRELSTLLQDNYVVTDLRRGEIAPGPALPGSWARMSDDDLRGAGIDPALLHDGKSGFDASFYRDAQGAVVLAYTGTDELKDWKHNLGQGLGFKDAQYDQAIALGRQAKEAYGDQLIVTGHSLGGGLAAASSMVNEIPAVTFNAAGVHDKTLERYGFDADVLKQEAEHGLIRSYAVKNEILTHLQEDSFPLKYAMPDAPGHRITLPDPDPQTVFERLVPGKMLKHRIDMHYIDAVMDAQDLADLRVRERTPGSGPATIGDAASTGNRLLGDAVDGLATQRRQLGLDDNEKFFNTAANVAARAGHDGLQRIDHLVATRDGDGVVAVQGGLHDPSHQRVHVAVDQASQVPARDSAELLRTQAQQSTQEPPAQTQQRGIALA